MKFRQRLTVRHLRLVATLGRELSLSRSARILNTSQSAASRGLGEIEKLLGARLFERSTRRVTPTRFGQSLVWYADQILTQLDRAEAEFDALARGVGGSLNIGVMGAFSPKYLVKAIKLVSEQAPKLTIRLRYNIADSLIADLASGRCDIIITHFDIRQFGSEDLDVDILYQEQVTVIAAPKHPLVGRKDVSWADLAKERWVLMPVETFARRAVERNLLMHAQTRIPVIEAFELHYIIALVRDAGMLTALPTALASWLEKDTKLVRCLPVTDGLAPWAMCVARLRSRRLPPQEALFIERLKQVVAEGSRRRRPKRAEKTRARS